MKKLMDIRIIVTKSAEGWSDSKIATEYQMSRNTVRKYRKRFWEARENYLEQEGKSKGQEVDSVIDYLNTPPKYNVSNRKPYKYTEELDCFLDSLLEEEEQKAQEEGESFKRTSKTQIHRTVREAGFEIGYTTISKKIDEKRLAHRNINPWSGQVTKSARQI